MYPLPRSGTAEPIRFRHPEDKTQVDRPSVGWDIENDGPLLPIDGAVSGPSLARPSMLSKAMARALSPSTRSQIVAAPVTASALSFGLEPKAFAEAGIRPEVLHQRSEAGSTIARYGLRIIGSIADERAALLGIEPHLIVVAARATDVPTPPVSVGLVGRAGPRACSSHANRTGEPRIPSCRCELSRYAVRQAPGGDSSPSPSGHGGYACVRSLNRAIADIGARIADGTAQKVRPVRAHECIHQTLRRERQAALTAARKASVGAAVKRSVAGVVESRAAGGSDVRFHWVVAEAGQAGNHPEPSF